MRAHSVDYLKDSGPAPGRRVHRGFWLHEVPRVMLACRAMGHRPVVDGTKGYRSDDPGARWVACARCGLRPEPQGNLDPARWDVGDRYTGPWDSREAAAAAAASAGWDERRRLVEEDPGRAYEELGRPGPWPARPTGTLGGELVLGRRDPAVGVAVKVGNAGSEQVLSGHVQLPWLGALYLHSQDHGRWVQRRLNPVGYDSRVVEVHAYEQRLFWKVWAKRDEWTRGTPRWQDGSAPLDPRDVWWGPKRYSYEDVGEPVTGMVRMPQGDEHQVRLQLQRQTLARQRRGRAAGRVLEQAWTVDWSSKKGIPVRNNDWKGDEVLGSSVTVGSAAVEYGLWVQEACAAVALACARDRARYQWRPPAPAAAGDA